MRYRFLEKITTADLAFEAFGKTIDELFLNAAEALTAAMVDPKELEALINHKLRIENKGLEELLFDFLSELVFLKDKDQLLFSKFKIKINKLDADNYSLNANLWGEKIDSQKHELRSDVKAVTWHQFKLEEKKGRYRTQVVLDI